MGLPLIIRYFPTLTANITAINLDKVGANLYSIPRQ